MAFFSTLGLLLLSCSTTLLLLCNANPIPGYHRNPIYRHPRSASHNCRDALTMSILFFECQRTGKLPPNQRVSWRRDSGLSDGTTAHVDLVGGYYDAGDNVKFGFPMVFTTTMLSWSVIEFGGLMKGEIQNARQAATAHPGTIYVQVGDATKDHACWERPEDIDTPRTVLEVDQNTPSSYGCKVPPSSSWTKLHLQNN